VATTDITKPRVVLEPEEPFDEWRPDASTTETVEANEGFVTPTVTRTGRVIRVPSRELPFLDPDLERRRAYRQALLALQRERVYRELVYFKLHSQKKGLGLLERFWHQLAALSPSISAGSDRRRISTAPAHPVLITGLNAWPRLLQVGAFYFTIGALLAAGHAISDAAGVCLAFLGLSAFCFANFAAWRRELPTLLLGPYVAVLGMWGCLVIAAAVGLNILAGS
jgi:hypothetical protein